MIIYIFGNTLVQEDAKPLQMISPLLQVFPDIVFEIVDPNEDFPPEEEKNPVIIDTVKGIDKPTIIHLSDLADIAKTPVSPHDYDLLFHLALLKKLKKINDAHIIGVPMNVLDQSQMINKVKQLINEILRSFTSE